MALYNQYNQGQRNQAARDVDPSTHPAYNRQMQTANVPYDPTNVNIPAPSQVQTPALNTQQPQQSWQTPMNPTTNTQATPPQNYVQPGGTGPGSQTNAWGGKTWGPDLGEEGNWD